jgi:hypothetical protein
LLPFFSVSKSPLPFPESLLRQGETILPAPSSERERERKRKRERERER